MREREEKAIVMVSTVLSTRRSVICRMEEKDALPVPDTLVMNGEFCLY